MKTRTLTVIFNAGVFLLLVALVLQAADASDVRFDASKHEDA